MATAGRTEMVELLLDRGADLEAKNNVKMHWLLSLPCPWSADDMRCAHRLQRTIALKA